MCHTIRCFRLCGWSSNPTAGQRQSQRRARRRLAKHHYLADVPAVGEQLWYALTDADGTWLGVLVFCAASRRLRARDQWNRLE